MAAQLSGAAASSPASRSAKSLAWQIIIIFGVVSLVGDVIYEGARSVNGAYLAALGANAAMVGLVAGIGEFLGYAVRLVSGWFADKSRAWWAFTLSGYAILAFVPLMALTGTWQLAALFIVLERFGKAVRAPSKDSILSSATKQVGTGIGFGLHEAMDQLGALIGPLVFTLVFALEKGRSPALASFRQGYAWLWIPFGLLALSLVVAFLRVPDPEKLEPIQPKKWESERLSPTFWLYSAFTFVTTLGFIGWPILSFHYAKTGLLSGEEIALYYALAMAVDGLMALLVGWVYDRFKARSGHGEGGLLVLLVIPLLSFAIPIFGFGATKGLALLAALFWGLVMGTHETIMKSAIADITPMHKRGTGYGVFNTVYGLSFFVSSTAMGLLYEAGPGGPILLAIAAEVLAIPLFILMRRVSARRMAQA